ncbi:hypothetical protein R1sor_018678 [Riccia sorocarpa]|uniref:Reverse transcriptase n=1 Tax=Riccia sorocarpa TaxID=122646 RepID=A0ABD3IAV5_9MARC
MGSSVVDYLLGTPAACERISSFTLEQLLPDSDHKPMICLLSGFKKSKPSKSVARIPIRLRDDNRAVYEDTLNVRLKPQMDADEVSRMVWSVARATLFTRKKEQNVWFDEACTAARQTALQASPEDSLEAFRFYRNFIRSKKRCFLREQQKRLVLELIRDPQDFWQRFRPVTSPVKLCPVELLDYVSQLYYFPLAKGMPAVSDTVCHISEDEVNTAVRSLRVGRAADLQGLRIEMIRWGGSVLLTTVTRLINVAKTD